MFLAVTPLLVKRNKQPLLPRERETGQLLADVSRPYLQTDTVGSVRDNSLLFLPPPMTFFSLGGWI